MGIRETINNQKWIGVAVAAIIFATAGVIVAYTFWPTGPTIHANQGFYTDDDGKTFFRDSLYRFPPFDHDGKTANGAIVYSYSNGNFVAYQFRYKPDAKNRLTDAYAKAQAGGNLADVAHLMGESDIAFGGTEIKMSGSDRWTGRTASPPPVSAPDHGDCMLVYP
jgi:hypothetical protein